MAARTGGKGLRVLRLTALALVLAVLAAQPTEGSNFVFFSSGCSGNSATLSACGCNTVPTNTRGGYRFTYAIQTAAAYNSPGCTGDSQTKFGTSDAQQCSSVGWLSVFIQC